MTRADHLLVARAIAPSRSAAQRLIERGAVRFRTATGWAVPRKAGEDLPDDCTIEVTDDAELRFVSRGGLKLAAALAHTGIDVGRGQLHPALAADARVQFHEGLNARDVTGSAFEAEHGGERFDLVVADLAFISLTLVLPTIAQYLGANALLLVKPQFELQPADIGKGGLVKHTDSYARVETRIREACAEHALVVRGYFESAVTGGDGNREFFAWAVPAEQG